jgi:drug/metabolite transporter (DMT)-like permease
LFLPLAIYEGISFDFSEVTLTGWLAIVYYGVMVTAVAFIFWFQGVSKVQASTSAVFYGVMPVSAVLFSYLILQEPFQWSHLWGGLCVLTGLGFIIRDSSHKKSPNKGDKQNAYPIRYLKDNVS